MAGRVEISFDADLKGFVQKAVEAARAVQGVEGGVEKLGKALTTAQKKIDDGAAGLDKHGKSAHGAAAGHHSLAESATHLVKELAAVAGIGISIEKVFEAIQEGAKLAREDVDKAAASLRGLYDASSQSLAIGGSGPAGNLAAAKRISEAAPGVGLAAAGAIAAKGTFLGVSEADQIALAKLQGVRGVDALSAMTSLNKLNEATGGGSNVGRMVNAALQVEGAARVPVSEVIGDAERFGVAGAAVGAGAEETLAFRAAIGKALGKKDTRKTFNEISRLLSEGVEYTSPPTADDQQRALRTGVPISATKNRLTFEGKGFIGGLRSLVASLPPEVAAEMARKDPHLGFVFRNLGSIEGAYQQSLAQIAGGGDALAAQEAALAGDTGPIGAIYRRKGEESIEQVEQADRSGTIGLGLKRSEAMLEEARAKALRGKSGLSRVQESIWQAGTSMRRSAAGWFRTEEEQAAANEAAIHELEHPAGAGGSSAALIEALNRNTAATERNSGGSAQLHTADTPAHDGVGNVQKPAQRVH